MDLRPGATLACVHMHLLYTDSARFKVIQNYLFDLILRGLCIHR